MLALSGCCCSLILAGLSGPLLAPARLGPPDRYQDRCRPHHVLRMPAQAVADGRWLVIEDVNLAPPDVLAALIPLLERRQLQLPQRAHAMHAAPGFQLIATVTSAPGAPILLPVYIAP